MTLEGSIEGLAPELASMPWPPAAQKARFALEARVERLTAELGQQESFMQDACTMAEELRGLSLLFHGVFCDTTLTEAKAIASQRVAAAYLIENVLNSMAQRLSTAEEQACRSRREALAEGAR